MILLAFLCVTLWLMWSLYRIVGYRYRTFAGRTVLVTGACSDVGRRLCGQLHAEGASVIAWDYSKLKLEELQRCILGGVALPSPLSSSSSVIGSTAASPTSNSTTLTARYNAARSTTPLPAGTSSSVVPSRVGKPGSPVTNVLGTGSSSSLSSASRRAFFDIATVDLSSRLQVQRAARELASALAAVHSSVDIIVNAAHLYPNHPMVERTEDSIEKVVTTNTITPLLLANALCPLMLGRKEGGHFVTFTTAIGGGGGSGALDALSPDYTGSQWGAAGAHYSIRAWLQQLQRAAKTPGEVKTTIVSLDAVRVGLAAHSTVANTAATNSSTSVSAILSAASSSDHGNAAAAGFPGSFPSHTTSASSVRGLPPGFTVGESGGNDSNSTGKSNAAASSFPSTVASSSPAAALDRLVQRSLRAIGRGEESFTDSRRAWLAPLALALPVPWMTRVLDILLWTRSRGDEGNRG